MTRSQRLGVMTGIATVVLFGSVGVILLAGEQQRVGALLLGIGLLRGVFVAQQIRAGMGTSEPPPSDNARPER